MDLATLAQGILDELHLVANTDQVYQAIFRSILHHKQNRLWISERTFEFAVVGGRSEYRPGDGYVPGGLVELMSPLYLLLDGNTTNSQRVTRLTSEEYDNCVSSNISPGPPTNWDFDHGVLRLWPTPQDETTDVLRGRYVVDIGCPTWKYVTSAYVYYTPEGNVLTSTYTNDWFTGEAASMIRARACYLILKALRDEAANDYLQLWLEEKARLEDESEALVAGGLNTMPGTLLD